MLISSLSDPYGTPELRIRRPDSDESEIIKTEDDPYQTEMNHFIDAVRPPPPALGPASNHTNEGIADGRLRADLNPPSYPATKTRRRRTS